MRLRGIKFSDIHTGDDWKLTLNEITLDPPEPKTYFVSVDGRNGDVDMSEALNGEIKYNNREAHFKFIMIDGTREERVALMDEIIQKLHGRKIEVILPDDQTHYIVGRWSVLNVVATASHTEFEIDGNCEPWKYATIENVRREDVTSERREVVYVNNGRKTLIPEITVTGTVNLEFGDNKSTLSDGTYKLLNLKLVTGNNLITVYGNGSLTLKYREAIL